MRVSAVAPRWGLPPPVALKTPNYPNLQSVTEARTISQWKSNFFSLYKNPHRVAVAKDSQLLYNGEKRILVMRKNSEQNIRPIEIDPVTNEYTLTIPEWLLNDMGWYEGTELEWLQDSDDIFIREAE